MGLKYGGKNSGETSNSSLLKFKYSIVIKLILHLLSISNMPPSRHGNRTGRGRVLTYPAPPHGTQPRPNPQT